MERIYQIARREFLETARSKWFLVGTIAGPVLIVGMMLIPGLIVQSGAAETRCAVLDETGVLLESLVEAMKHEEALEAFVLVDVPAETTEHYTQAVQEGDYGGFLHIPADVFESNLAGYYAKGLGVAAERLDNVLTKVIAARRLEGEGLAPERIKDLTHWVSIESFQIGKEGKAEKKRWLSVYLVTMIFIMLIYVTIALYGASIMNSTVQEKTNRVVEVLLSSTTPFELFLGKLLGRGAVGLTQYAVWAVAGSVFVLYGGSMMSAGGGGMQGVLTVPLFVWFVVFFLLGFFSMASVFAALGSTCNSPQEATQMQFPAILPLLVALMLSFMVLAHPDSTWGVVASFVPFISPILMFARIAVQTPPLWQILLAVLINLAAIIGTTWLAARIYRIGILMYGKRPSLPEVMRWIRAA